MSVAGIDFGNLNMLIAQTAKGGVDVILNDSSNRQTATAVSVQGKERFIGDSGAALARTNLLNTVMGMKLLVGRKYDDADVQRELAKVPYRTEKMAHGGVGIIVSYNDQPMTISAEHFLGMVLVKAKDISLKANNGINLADSVLAVPHWFTQAQRRSILQACEIAGLNCLKVTNESNAIALSFGIFKSAKKLFSETEPTHVMFIDMGYTGYCVTIVDFIQENMRVRSTVCDRHVGGRDFDDVIIEFLAEEFQKKTGINVRNNKKAILKLQAAAEKAKKTLSPAGVSEASISVECLAEDRDLNALLTKDEFERRAAPLVNRLRDPIERALREAGLSKKDLAETEVVGGSTRINIVKKTLGEILELDPAAMNYGLKTTMNADEAVCRGAALQCAMLSSRLKVKPFHIVDTLAYGIDAHFDATPTSGEDESPVASTSRVSLYKRGDEIPHKPRRVTFRNKTADFSIVLQYDDESSTLLPPGESRFIGRYTVHVPAEHREHASDIRVTFGLDKSGLVYLQSAQLLQELTEAETKEAEAKEAEGKSADENKNTTEAKEGDTAAKKRFRKIDLQVSIEEHGLSRDQIKAAIEIEASMAFEDRLIQETADKRNELESYIYSMRDRLDGNLKEYATPAERDQLKSLMTVAEDWLYNEGFESTKGEYARKIDELRLVGDKIELRFNEVTARPPAIDALKKQMDLCKSFAANYDEAHAHISDEDRDRIRKEVQKTESWLYDHISRQDELPTNADPILTADLIAKKRNDLFVATNPIMIKPKPKPVEPAAQPQANTNSNNSDSKDAKDANSDTKSDGKDTAMDEDEPAGAEAK
jgi:heat shock protein 4